MEQEFIESKEKIEHNQLLRYITHDEMPINLELHKERTKKINMVLYMISAAFILGIISYVFGLMNSNEFLFSLNDDLVLAIRGIISSIASFLGLLSIILLLKARKSVIREEIRHKRLLQRDI